VLVGWVVWARCWVLRERATKVVRYFSAGALETGCCRTSGIGLTVVPRSLWVLAPWYGVGSARSLRTAQWTRASLYL
jgi:hypothetical protein